MLDQHCDDRPASRTHGSPELAVIEILETILPDDEVADAVSGGCAPAGYRVALDDVVADDPRMVLLDVVDVVKLDIAATTVDEWIAPDRRCRVAGVITLAAKVETLEQHDEAARLGCVLFQGYFFQKPAIVGARETHGTCCPTCSCTSWGSARCWTRWSASHLQRCSNASSCRPCSPRRACAAPARWGDVLALVRAYEQGEWQAVQHHAAALDAPPEQLVPSTSTASRGYVT